MHADLLIFLVIFSLGWTTSGLSIKEVVDAFVDDTLRGQVQCSNPNFRNILFVVGGYYGHECYSSDGGATFEMKFTQCILERNEDNFTYLSDTDLVRIIKRKEYNGPTDGDMAEICNYIGNPNNSESISGAVTDLWEIRLGDYPNGIYDVIPQESDAKLRRFQYHVINLNIGPIDQPLEPVIVSSNTCNDESTHHFNTTHHIRGAALYGCAKNQPTPQFLGCAYPPLQSSHSSGVLPIELFAVYGATAEDDLRLLRSFYAYVGFKSPRRPMEEIQKMTLMQLCARIAVELHDTFQHVNMPLEFASHYIRDYPVRYLHRFPIWQ